MRYEKGEAKQDPMKNNILRGTTSAQKLWQHVWGEKGQHVWDLKGNFGKHRVQLVRAMERIIPECIKLKEQARMRLAHSFLEEAIAEKCRGAVELVGMARDRRTLNHIEEVIQGDNCKTLMCFICNSKHVYYRGLNAFGEEYNAGRIDYRNKELDRAHLKNLFAEARSEDSFFDKNLCAKRYKQNYGAAVEKDADLFKENNIEWQRIVTIEGAACGEVLCNPEDVQSSSRCKHATPGAICGDCAIPICNECWKYATQRNDIPKALCNDNFVGYIRRYFLQHNVTWLESTIACPLFSGLIIYYIEGVNADRHHLMMEKTAQPRLSYGVRGNIFSYLMDWEQTQTDLSKMLQEGDVWDWPMDRRRASQVVTFHRIFIFPVCLILKSFPFDFLVFMVSCIIVVHHTLLQEAA